MLYDFPHNLHIDEVRAAIKEHNEEHGVVSFIEADKGTHVIFNYLVAFEHSFPRPNTGDAVLDRKYAILRECRGLVMSKTTGEVLSRRYHKFFNVMQKPETQLSEVDFSNSHVIMEKLDGSMITMYNDDNGKFCVGTKMGETDVATPALNFILDHSAYVEFAKWMIANHLTGVFEWCTRKQKIVLDYPDDRLVLTAIRNNITGDYMSYEFMTAKAQEYGIDIVRVFGTSVGNIEEFIAEARLLENAEGYVIRFDSGGMVKIKGDWYCRIHDVKEKLNLEKNVLSLVLSDTLDDALSMMDQVDRNRVEQYNTAILAAILQKATSLADFVKDCKTKATDKKQFAMEFVSKLDSMERALAFSIWDGKNEFEVVRDFVLKNISTSTKIETIRPFLGGLSWYDFRETVLLDD